MPGKRCLQGQRDHIPTVRPGWGGADKPQEGRSIQGNLSAPTGRPRQRSNGSNRCEACRRPPPHSAQLGLARSNWSAALDDPASARTPHAESERQARTRAGKNHPPTALPAPEPPPRLCGQDSGQRARAGSILGGGGGSGGGIRTCVGSIWWVNSNGPSRGVRVVLIALADRLSIGACEGRRGTLSTIYRATRSARAARTFKSTSAVSAPRPVLRHATRYEARGAQIAF